MVIKALLQELLDLSPEERIQLAQDLWDTVADEAETMALTDAQRQELDRRLEAYQRGPQAGSPWEDVKARLRVRL